MSQTISGVVEKTSSQESAPGAARKWTKKSFLVDGTWYGVFVNKDNSAKLASINPGSTVKIEFEVSGKFSNAISVEVLSAAQAAASPEVAKSVDTLNEKDLRITFNGSLKSALAFVEVAMRLDMLPLPAKKDARADAFYKYVVHYTNLFVAETYAAKLVAVDSDVAAEASEENGDE